VCGTVGNVFGKADIHVYGLSCQITHFQRNQIN